MGRKIAVSFEHDQIKVAYAALHRGSLAVQKTLVLTYDEFDLFLKKEHARHFTVVADFKSFYQDILLVPSVKEGFLSTILRAEIRKRAPELKEFTFFYTLLGEKPFEGKKMREAFVYAVSNEDLYAIVNRFTRRNKTVDLLSPNIFPVASFIASTSDHSDETILCVMESGMSKTLFVLEKGRVSFIRSAQSLGSGIDTLDAQNINMTINYCRQTLKFNPSRVVLIGTAASAFETKLDVIVPVVSLLPPKEMKAPVETALEYGVPLAALRVPKPKEGDLLPMEYKSVALQRKVFSSTAALLLLFSLIGVGYIYGKLSAIAALNTRIQALTAEIQRSGPAYNDYRQRYEELQAVMPLVNALNNANSSVDFQRALLSLQALTTRNIEVQSITVTGEGAEARIQIKGIIAEKEYTGLQAKYQDMLEALKATEGITVASQKLDLKERTFEIALLYKAKAS